jgi:hypothetical protein
MRPLPVHDEAGLETAVLALVAAEVQPVRTLGSLLAWGRVATPAGRPIDIVTQDELATRERGLRFACRARILRPSDFR